MSERKYYEAYEDRYKQVHAAGLQWASDEPSPIVLESIDRLALGKDAKMLEIGCGEGRDAAALLARGFALTATDISSEAISHCRAKYPPWAGRFQVLDCLTDSLDVRFDFIYAVAVLHMLVEDAHRAGFYCFIREHLTMDGAALICTMGDGEEEFQSDPSTAFDLALRTHEATGKALMLAGTSCRVVSADTFHREIEANGLTIIESGRTSVEPDFPVMLYAVVRRQ